MVTVVLVGTGSLPSTQARLPAAVSEVCSLPWKLKGGDRKQKWHLGGQPLWLEEGMQALALLLCRQLQAPLPQKSPRLQSCLAPTERDARMGVPRGGEGSAEKHPNVWC